MTSPYRNPDQEREFLEEQFKSYFSEFDAAEKAQADADAAIQAAKATQDAEDRFWGFAEPPESLVHKESLPADHFRLAELINQPWTGYKGQAWIKKHLFKVGVYPDRLARLGLITKVGFGILVENKHLAEQARDRARVAKARAAKRAALALARANLLELLRKRSSP
jgi:hypothetical protein